MSPQSMPASPLTEPVPVPSLVTVSVCVFVNVAVIVVSAFMATEQPDTGWAEQPAPEKPTKRLPGSAVGKMHSYPRQYWPAWKSTLSPVSIVSVHTAPQSIGPSVPSAARCRSPSWRPSAAGSS